jgi:hypothetical protein
VAGHVLVLDNERVLHGDIERRGDVYIIRGAVGELTVPVSKALTVCASLKDAYKFLSNQVNQNDGDQRLKLARWCHTNGLLDSAIVEAKASLQLRPGHAESKQFLAMLQRVANPITTPPGPVAETVAASDIAPLPVSGDCFTLFATKVQPILMNACASCHSTGRGGGFVLTRPNDATGRRATQINLGAAIQQISFDRPDASPLLQKACSLHGWSTHAPFINRQAVPFATLQEWAELLVKENRHLRPQGTASPVTAAVPELPHTTAPAGVAPAARQVEIVPSPIPSPESEPVATPRPVVAEEAPSPSGSSPYDPAPFNQSR